MLKSVLKGTSLMFMMFLLFSASYYFHRASTTPQVNKNYYSGIPRPSKNSQRTQSTAKTYASTTSLFQLESNGEGEKDLSEQEPTQKPAPRQASLTIPEPAPKSKPKPEPKTEPKAEETPAPKEVQSIWPQKLIVLGYKNSGSSITAAIIHSHPDAGYYIYEPIWYIQDPDTSGIAVSDVRVPLIRRIKSRFHRFPLKLEPFRYMRDTLECRLTPEHKKFMLFIGDSRNFKELYKCSNTNPEEKCYKEMNQRCIESKVRMFKTVRLAMFEAVKMMERDPQLKVLHVIRDPRGTQMSRLPVRDRWTIDKQRYLNGSLSEFYQTVDKELHGQFFGEDLSLARKGIRFVHQCKIIDNDLDVSLKFSSRHPGRVMTIRYEDLALDPYETTTNMLRFIGLDMKKEVKDTINLLMFGGQDGEKIIQASDTGHKLEYSKRVTNQNFQSQREYIRRSDPVEAASRWRRRGEFEIAEKVQKDCAAVFDILRFRKFKTKSELLDLEILPILPWKDNGV